MAVQVASEDPEAGLRAVAALRRLLERLEVAAEEQMLATLVRHSANARRLLFELDVPVGTLADRLTR